ncbi:hypothetical protein JOY44_28870 (plasmid) [Phormidium sp. CLA17]|uniref:hypothetical protein n=1 Tax=Leptolyngbya sp. Cla-17 TaxID=2803751 RepID=UPI0014910410|nr:hypothetical protein [Leptolyngbya sp. Cla-17]MBM0745438.1 hypothetical protein [Leptolyngbya sp. Cla-17]
MALVKLQAEFSQLQSLYFSSFYSAKIAIKSLKIEKKDGSRNFDEPIISTSNSKKYNIPNGYTIHKFLGRRYLKQVREVIFVRVISSLEVFLIDSVKTLFMSRKDLFNRNEKVEFNYGELLSADSITEIWAKLIQRECRRLQNQGFLEMRKFYQQRLQIDFSKSSIALKKLEEMHDRRHLLVHRLGKTDAYYRHKYSDTSAQLEISEDYLLDALRTIENFASYIESEVIRLSKIARKANYNPRNYRVKIELTNIEEKATLILDPEYRVTLNNRDFLLDEIIEFRIGTDTELTLILAGATSDVCAYTEQLKRLENKKLLAIQERVILSKGFQCSLTDEQVTEIANRLPKQPWPKNIHKVIAQELGFSNNQVSTAILLILDSPEMFGAEDKIKG